MARGKHDETFHWSECAQRLGELHAAHALTLDRRGRSFTSCAARVYPPLVCPIREAPQGIESAADLAARRMGNAGADDLGGYLDSLPVVLPLHGCILMQAGAVSIGMFEAGEALATKTMKRYVVRGKGRAQPTYLASKGKSRYGSRLRLRNARLLLGETNERLRAYWKEFGAPEQIYVSAPTRLWPELFQAQVTPPFDAEQAIQRIPLDLGVPTTDVLLRAYRSLCYGRITWAPEAESEA